MFLISRFRRILNVVCYLLGCSPAGEQPKQLHTTLMLQITKHKQQIETNEREHELQLTKIEWSALLTFAKLCAEKLQNT
jgi:hypothetical protein